MVSHTIRECGNDISSFNRDETEEMREAAIEAIPKGKEAVVEAIKDILYSHYAEFLYVRGTNQYKPGSEAYKAVRNATMMKHGG